MNKIKPKIKLKQLSWEMNKNFYYCDNKDCNLEGKYKAPKSKINLKNYYFFCLKHIKEYNKSWDYYKGMSVNQIELSLRQDVIWNRPSWPTNGSPKYINNTINSIFNNNFEFSPDYLKFNKNNTNKNAGINLSVNEKKSLEILSIQLPITLEKIKSSYKKLVKKYHPDINRVDNNAEKKFKEVNSAYKILLKKILGK